MNVAVDIALPAIAGWFWNARAAARPCETARRNGARAHFSRSDGPISPRQSRRPSNRRHPPTPLCPSRPRSELLAAPRPRQNYGCPPPGASLGVCGRCTLLHTRPSVARRYSARPAEAELHLGLRGQSRPLRRPCAAACRSGGRAANPSSQTVRRFSVALQRKGSVREPRRRRGHVPAPVAGPADGESTCSGEPVRGAPASCTCSVRRSDKPVPPHLEL